MTGKIHGFVDDECVHGKNMREYAKVIHIGDNVMGGGNTSFIPSITTTKTEDRKATLSKIFPLEEAGCDRIRCAVPTRKAAKEMKEIKKQIYIHLLQKFILILNQQLNP